MFNVWHEVIGSVGKVSIRGIGCDPTTGKVARRCGSDSAQMKSSKKPTKWWRRGDLIETWKMELTAAIEERN